MDYKSQLRKEIDYWSKLISSHKKSSQTSALKHASSIQQGKLHGYHGHVYSTSNTSQIKSVNKQKTFLNSSSRYKWKSNQSVVTTNAVPSAFKEHSVKHDSSNSATVVNPALRKTVLHKHKLPKHSQGMVHAQTSPPPAKMRCISSKDLCVVQHKADSTKPKTRYKWLAQGPQVKYPKYAGRLTQHYARSTPTESRHDWRRRKSLKRNVNRISTKGTAIMGSRIVSKYKLRRITQRRLTDRVTSTINVSSNPYKVIKKRTELFKNSSLSSNAPTHHCKANAPRAFKQNRQAPVHGYTGRYKVVRYPIQTRSLKTGNIVLRRKQSTYTAKASMPHQRHPTYCHSHKQRIASHVLHKSLHTVRSRNKHKLCKVFCTFYNRFGKCNRGAKCLYTHDPERVAVCTRFLRGTCKDESCLFSHKISKKKVPVCNFFLQGKCSSKNCPYLHVFVGRNAPVCKAFATAGYCPKAENCKHRHIVICLEYYNKGSCSQQRCVLPHIRKSQSSSSLDGKKVDAKMPPRNKGMDGAVKLVQKSSSISTQTTDIAESQSLRIQPNLKLKKSTALPSN